MTADQGTLHRSVKLTSLEQTLEHLPAGTFRYRLLKSHLSYLSYANGFAVAAFRACLAAARAEIATDRGLLNDVAEAAFCMRELESLGALLGSIHGIPIYLYIDGHEAPESASTVRCSLGSGQRLQFEFSEDLQRHPYAPVLLKHWVTVSAPSC